MKNIYKCILLTISFCFLIGCGKEQVIEPEEDTYEEIEVVIETQIKSPTEMTKEELLSLDINQIKEMVEIYLPNYRETYGIDKDKIMQDKDWLELRDYIYYQIYGEIISNETLEDKKYESYINTDDPNWIYYAPTVEFLENMDKEAFIQYMTNLSKYNGVIGDVDFTILSDIELEALKNDTIKNLAIDYKEKIVE